MQKIGEGAAGFVYRVSDRTNSELRDRHRALKVVSGTNATLTRILKEIDVGDISHQNLVRTIDYGWLSDTEKDSFFIVMELVSGGTLSDVIARSNAEGLPLDVGRVRRLSLGILHGLDALHRRNIVHRDLKPGNILLEDSDGTEERPMLSDFGIAHHANTGQTTLGSAGTLGYAAPEQLRGTATCASDIYSFGKMLYELLVGKLPSYGDAPLIHARPELPSSVDTLIRECLSEHPGRRPATAGDLLQRFDSAWPRHASTVDHGRSERSEHAIARMIEAHEFTKAIDNCAIERKNRRMTPRLEWLCAQACRMAGRNAEAHDSYSEAIRLSAPVAADLRKEFAAFLTALGRLEDAAEQYQLLLSETSDNSSVREYLKVLLELGRGEHAADVAVDRQVIPDEPTLLEQAGLKALQQGDYAYVVECGASAEESGQPSPTITAATGIALYELGDHLKAEPLLHDSQGHAHLGPRVRQCLWSAYMQLDKFASASELGERIASTDKAWLADHGSALIRAAVKSHDASRLSDIIRRLGPTSCPQELLEPAFELLRRHSHSKVALSVALEEALRLAVISLDDQGSIDDPSSLRISLAPSVADGARSPGFRQRADAAIRRIIEVLSVVSAGSSANASLASQAIVAGIDGRLMREARFDGASSIETRFEDARWLRNNGAFAEGSRRSLLLDAAGKADKASASSEWLSRCIALLPDWREPKLALLRHGTDSRDFQPSDAQVQLARFASTADSVDREVRDCALERISEWQRRQDRLGEVRPHRVIAAMSEQERLGLVKSALASGTRSGQELARRVAGDANLLLDQTLRIQAFRAISDTAGADADGSILKLLVYIAASTGNLPEAEAACQQRAEIHDGGRPTAHTVIAALANPHTESRRVIEIASLGDEDGEFAALTWGTRGLAWASTDHRENAIANLERCIECLENDTAREVASLFGVTTARIHASMAGCLAAEERYGRACEHFLAVPEQLRDKEWFRRASHSLWQAGRGKEVSELLRPRIANPPRDLELVFLRFYFDDPALRIAAIKDAAALGAEKFPWCQPLAASDIQPLKAIDTIDRDIAAVEAQDVGSIDIRRKAWCEIADLLAIPAIATATSLPAAKARVDDLLKNAFTHRTSQAFDILASKQAAANRAEEIIGGRGRVSTDGYKRTRKVNASDVLRGLADLSSDTCLVPTHRRLTLWAMDRLAFGSLKGSREEKRMLAEELVRSAPYRTLSETAMTDDRHSCLMLSAIEQTAGLLERAHARFEAHIRSQSGISSPLATLVCIAAGFRPGPARWDWKVRLAYAFMSRDWTPFAIRLSLAALLVCLCFASQQILAVGMASLTAWIVVTVAMWLPCPIQSDPTPSSPRSPSIKRLWHLVCDACRRLEDGDIKVVWSLVLALLLIPILLIVAYGARMP